MDADQEAFRTWELAQALARLLFEVLIGDRTGPAVREALAWLKPHLDALAQDLVA